MKERKEKVKEILNEEHCGFAITIEVLATLFMLFVFLTFTLYFLRVMDVQRYMNTVMTSTAEQAARWGGMYTKAYQLNVSGGKNLRQLAQEQLNAVAPDFNPIITGTPDTISYDGQKITVKISYKLPAIFSTYSKVYSPNGQSFDASSVLNNMSMKVSVRSIMEAGRLL